MGLLGRRGSLRNGIEGTAVIRRSEPFGEPGRRNNSGESIFDLELNRFGTRRYTFTLEVRTPDRDPYEVEGQFKVPRKAENTGWLAADVGNKLQPGLELPVRVDPADPSSVEIDWDRYLASPGRKTAQRAASEAGRIARAREQLERNPKLVEKLRAQNRVALEAWVEAVRIGNMSREEFEKTVQLELDSGRMDPADAEAARGSLD